jgi:hypothetical protein
MLNKFLTLVLFFFISFASLATNNKESKLLASKVKSNVSAKIELMYNSLNSNNFSLPQIDCFKKALEGFYKLKAKGQVQKDILTVIDFSMSSTKKRMWVIDLLNNKILFNTVVSHGLKSGGEFASNFSNQPNSNKSSLGFYATGETYNGKHGLSLKLDGLEIGINHNARSRSVVVHGAKYANPSILKSQGFLGRSQGCPALPEAQKAEIIQIIKGKSCLFIYHPTKSYEVASKLAV